MTTRIDILWEELERAPDRHPTVLTGWWMRLADPEVNCLLYAAISTKGRNRGLLMRLARENVPPRRHWVNCKGLEIVSVADGAFAYWGVILTDVRFLDVFAALAVDLQGRVADLEGEGLQAKSFLSQLKKWKNFLASDTRGLTGEQRRGLWGELFVLRDLILPAWGNDAVSSWKGPLGAEQDFQFEKVALETKTTVARQPQCVRISSERQLDNRGWRRLFLLSLSVEERVGDRESLPDLVKSVRAALRDDPVSADRFEDLLLESGYHRIHEELYRDLGYLIRRAFAYRVKRGFPRIVENRLPDGVGGVSYDLALSACGEFEIEQVELAAELRRSVSR